jgi:hypothetical protein
VIDPSIKVNVPPFYERVFNPTVSLTVLGADNNLDLFGVRGIRIHTRINFIRRENLDSLISVYFFDEWGRPLIDINGFYRDVYGQVALAQRVGQPLVPVRGPLTVSLFMPYSELHVQPGTRVLCRFKVNDAGVRITSARTNFYSFTVPRL